MTKTQLFKQAKKEFLTLCKVYKLPLPEIKLAPQQDLFNITDPPTAVQIYIETGATQLDIHQQTRHIFGHYIADLHNINQGYSDLVANAIEQMLEQIENKVQFHPQVPY